VPPPVVAERRRRLKELERELAADYHRRLVGRRLDVMVEGADPQRPGWVRGTSCRYAPVAFPAHAPALTGRRVPVRVERLADDVLLGRPEPEYGPVPSAPEGNPAPVGRFALPLVVP
jgi:tRNA A37 methylthiotransferase MiaB